jgi:hypothetical protein
VKDADQADLGVVLGAQQVEELGAGALVPADDRQVARGQLSDRRRLPEIAGDDAMEHGENATAQKEPQPD